MLKPSERGLGDLQPVLAAGVRLPGNEPHPYAPVLTEILEEPTT